MKLFVFTVQLFVFYGQIIGRPDFPVGARRQTQVLFLLPFSIDTVFFNYELGEIPLSLKRGGREADGVLFF